VQWTVVRFRRILDWTVLHLVEGKYHVASPGAVWARVRRNKAGAQAKKHVTAKKNDTVQKKRTAAFSSSSSSQKVCLELCLLFDMCEYRAVAVAPTAVRPRSTEYNVCSGGGGKGELLGKSNTALYSTL
jgi:hypothetical protein